MTAPRLGWVLFTVAAIVALYLARDAIAANARADAAHESWKRTEAQYVAQRQADSTEIATRTDTITALRTRMGSAAAAVERGAQAAERVADTVERLITDTATARAFATYRALVRETLDSARVVITRADSIQREWESKEAAWRRDLGTVQRRLAEAITRAESAERARRPTLLTHATKILAVIGTVVVVDRAACAAGVRTLLPCGEPTSR